MTRRDKADWQLTADALARLLAHLDPDPERAGDRYEALRRTLVKFFDWRGATSPDDCADQTLDRLARKLDQGEAIADVGRYALGIARLVALEQMRDPLRHAAEVTETTRPDAAMAAGGQRFGASPAHAGEDDDDADGVRGCLERCLEELPEESRTLILRYYVHEKRAKIDARAALAVSLGLSANALRSRASRLRDRLEQCVARCRGAREAGQPIGRANAAAGSALAGSAPVPGAAAGGAPAAGTPVAGAAPGRALAGGAAAGGAAASGSAAGGAAARGAAAGDTAPGDAATRKRSGEQ